jgi:hypothetical protein
VGRLLARLPRLTTLALYDSLLAPEAIPRLERCFPCVDVLRRSSHAAATTDSADATGHLRGVLNRACLSAT